MSFKAADGCIWHVWHTDRVAQIIINIVLQIKCSAHNKKKCDVNKSYYIHSVSSKWQDGIMYFDHGNV